MDDSLTLEDIGFAIVAGIQLLTVLDRSPERQAIYRMLDWLGRSAAKGEVLAAKVKETERLFIQLRQEKRPPTLEEWNNLLSREASANELLDQVRQDFEAMPNPPTTPPAI